MHLKNAKAPEAYLEHLTVVQCKLIDLGSHIATPIDSSSEGKLQQTEFEGEYLTKQLEEQIDLMTA